MAPPERMTSSTPLVTSQRHKEALCRALEHVEAVLALPAPARDAVVLRHLEDVPPREIARRLGGLEALPQRHRGEGVRCQHLLDAGSPVDARTLAEQGVDVVEVRRGRTLAPEALVVVVDGDPERRHGDPIYGSAWAREGGRWLRRLLIE